MEIVPIHNRLLIEREKSEEKTEGGIYLPETAQQKMCRGKVTAAGDGERYNDKVLPMTVKVGDRILFSKLSGTDIQIDGKDYVLLREPEVHCILKEKGNGKAESN